MNTEATPPTLRDRHKEQTRQLILQAFVSCLEDEHESNVAIPVVAKKAGVSVRTVYRHFPSQIDLMAGASEWINRNVFPLLDLDGLEKLPEIYREAVARYEQNHHLAYALARTQIGQGLRTGFRAQLLERLKEIMDTEHARISPITRQHALASLAVLDNVTAWATLRDELGFSAREISDSIGWAMELILRELEDGEAPRNILHEPGASLPDKPRSPIPTKEQS